MSITLGQILDAARARAAALAPHRAALEQAAVGQPPPPDFVAALRQESIAVIAEIKRQSPSVGTINAGLDPSALARTYAASGAAAISVLTDERYFGGSLTDLEKVTEAVALPVLRKDFILTEEQLLEARAAGAAAALLIVRALEQRRLVALIHFARALGVAPLVEAHDENELLRATDAGAVIIGVNSRNLDTFTVDVPKALTLIEKVPAGCVAVAESGVATRRHVLDAASAGADAVLVGSALSGAADPARMMAELTGVERRGR